MTASYDGEGAAAAAAAGGDGDGDGANSWSYTPHLCFICTQPDHRNAKPTQPSIRMVPQPFIAHTGAFTYNR